MKNKTNNFLFIVLLISLLSAGCIAVTNKKTAKKPSFQVSQKDTLPLNRADSIAKKLMPPVTKIQGRYGFYVIDTLKEKVSIEQFLKQYGKTWIGISKYDELKPQKPYKAEKNIKEKINAIGELWVQWHAHLFKGVFMHSSGLAFYTKNNFVVYFSNNLILLDTASNSVTPNFTPEQIQAIVKEDIKEKRALLSIPTPSLSYDYSSGRLCYALTVYSYPDANKSISSQISDAYKGYSIDAKTGEIIRKDGYFKHYGFDAVPLCLHSCSADNINIGDDAKTNEQAGICDDEPITLYPCNNLYDYSDDVSVPTFGNKATSCPPELNEFILDDRITCRQVSVTKQQNCNNEEYNYALYNTTSTPLIAAYEYQSPVGLSPDLYQKDFVKIPNNSNYLFKNNVLAATSAYWDLHIAYNFFVAHGVPNFDANNPDAPIEVVAGSTSGATASARWLQFVTPGNQPVFTKQIHIVNADESTDLYNVQLNVIAHEYAHAVIGNYFKIVTGAIIPKIDSIFNGSQKANEEEADALHESLSDIFAILVMNKAREDGVLCNDATVDKWLMYVNQLEKRHLNNPLASQTVLGIPQASYYKNTDWVATETAYPNNSYLPYYKGGIIGYWFYLATNGSTEPVGGISDICGLGLPVTTNILFKTLELFKKDADTVQDVSRRFVVPNFEDFCTKTLAAIQALDGIAVEEKCEYRKCVLKAWKAVGLCLNVPGGKTESEEQDEPCFIDLRMRDCLNDQGFEPNTECKMDEGWQNIWVSPDLWNCPDNNLCNPEEWGAPAAVKTNQMRFTIYNAHPDLNSDPAKLHLYYTMASTGEDWEYNWVDYFYTGGNYQCHLGDEIVNSPVTIPPISAQSYYTGEASWSPPNFVNSMYPFYADPIDCLLSLETDPSDGMPKYEICLLARLESDADAIREESFGSITNNVINSNNIVTRNTFLIDPGVGIGAGNPPFTAGHPSIMLVANNNLQARHLDILFDKISSGSIELLANLMEISFKLSPELWNKWTETGKKSVGISIIAEREVKITNFETAKLLDIPFNGQEFSPIAIKVTILSNSGKNLQTSNFPKHFGFRITHQSSNNEPINAPSNCLFTVKNLTQQVHLAQTFSNQLICTPNPFINELEVQFLLDQDEATNVVLYDLQGCLVKTIFNNQVFTKGKQSIAINSQGLLNGMYICQLTTPSKQISQKVVKIK